MGIFDRMGRVISANLNSLFDRLEDPRKLVELDLDAADEQIRRGKQELVEAMGSEKQLRRKVEELDSEVGKWDQRAELAVKAGDEALAREALRKKRTVTEERERAERVRLEQAAVALRMRDELKRAEEKLEEWRMRKGTLAARAQQAKSPGGAEALGSRTQSTALSEFRRMEDRIEGREIAATAAAEVEDALGRGPSAEDLEARFRQLEAQMGTGAAASPELEEELLAIKRRVKV
jgi:phage shock protein A